MTSDFDLLILGGGLVGVSLACALGGQGLRIGLAEAVTPNSDGGPGYDDRSLALAYGSRRIFEGMRLWDRLAAEVTPIHRIHISERGRFGAARIDRAEEGVEALGYVVPSRALGRVLMDRLATLDGVELLCPVTLDGFSVQPDLVQVRLQTDGRARAVNARLLVAADGARSAVRTALHIPTRHWEYGQTAVLANITPGRPHGHVAYERFTDQGPLALLPLDADRCAMVWTRRDAAVAGVLALNDADFLAALQTCFGGRLGRLLRVGARSVQPLSLTLAREAVRPRVALIGNAAHTIHPVAGQGFNLGLRDVAVLAEVVARAVAEGRDPGHRVVLDAYAQWRRQDQRRVALFTDGLARIFTSPLGPVAALRNAGLLALDLCPPVKHLLTRRTMGIAGRLPRLARGLGL